MNSNIIYFISQIDLILSVIQKKRRIIIEHNKKIEEKHKQSLIQKPINIAEMQSTQKICVDVRCTQQQRLFKIDDLLQYNNHSRHCFVDKSDIELQNQDLKDVYSLKLNTRSYRLYMEILKKQMNNLSDEIKILEQMQEGEPYLCCQQDIKQINLQNAINKINLIISHSQNKDQESPEIQEIFQDYKTNLVENIKKLVERQTDKINKVLEQMQSNLQSLSNSLIDDLIGINKPIYSFKPNPRETKTTSLHWMLIKDKWTSVETRNSNPTTCQIGLINQQLPKNIDSKITFQVEEKGENGIFFGIAQVNQDKLQVGDIFFVEKNFMIGSKAMKLINDNKVNKEYQPYPFIEKGDKVEVIYSPIKNIIKIINLNPNNNKIETLEVEETNKSYQFYIMAFGNNQKIKIIQNQSSQFYNQI